MPREILITGGTGFVGSELTLQALRQGYDVIALNYRPDNATPTQIQCAEYKKSLLYARAGSGNQEHLRILDGDITSASQMQFILETYQPQTLIHAAATLSLLDPDQKPAFYETNRATAFANCIAAYQSKAALHCIFISSILVFDDAQGMINENTTLFTPDTAPSDYIKSKILAMQDWQRAGVQDLTVLYPPQIVGAYQFTNAILPRIMRKYFYNEGEILSLNGSYNPLGVEKFAQIVLDLCQNRVQNKTFCIGGEGEIVLSELAMQVMQSGEAYLNQSLVFKPLLKQIKHTLKNTGSVFIANASTVSRPKALINDDYLKQHLSIDLHPIESGQDAVTRKLPTIIQAFLEQGRQVPQGLQILGIEQNDYFPDNPYAALIREQASFENDEPISQKRIVWGTSFSGRSAVTGFDVDKLPRLSDLEDDYRRMMQLVRILKLHLAEVLHKKPETLATEDCKIPVLYCGRSMHNVHLYAHLTHHTVEEVQERFKDHTPEQQEMIFKQVANQQLPENKFHYPGHQFMIRHIGPTQNTIAQRTTLLRNLAQMYLPKGSVLAMASSAYHIPRVMRTLSYEPEQWPVEVIESLPLTQKERDETLKALSKDKANSYLVVRAENEVYYIDYAEKIYPLRMKNKTGWQDKFNHLSQKQNNAYVIDADLIIALWGHIPDENPLTYHIVLFFATGYGRRPGDVYDISGEIDGLKNYIHNKSIPRYPLGLMFSSRSQMVVQQSFFNAKRFKDACHQQDERASQQPEQMTKP